MLIFILEGLFLVSIGSLGDVMRFSEFLVRFWLLRFCVWYFGVEFGVCFELGDLGDFIDYRFILGFVVFRFLFLKVGF